MSHAQYIRKLSQSGKLNKDTILSIMSEQKKPDKKGLSIPMDNLRKYFHVPIPLRELKI